MPVQELIIFLVGRGSAYLYCWWRTGLQRRTDRKSYSYLPFTQQWGILRFLFGIRLQKGHHLILLLSYKGFSLPLPLPGGTCSHWRSGPCGIYCNSACMGYHDDVTSGKRHHSMRVHQRTLSWNTWPGPLPELKGELGPLDWLQFYQCF